MSNHNFDQWCARETITREGRRQLRRQGEDELATGSGEAQECGPGRGGSSGKGPEAGGNVG